LFSNAVNDQATNGQKENMIKDQNMCSFCTCTKFANLIHVNSPGGSTTAR